MTLLQQHIEDGIARLVELTTLDDTWRVEWVDEQGVERVCFLVHATNDERLSLVSDGHEWTVPYRYGQHLAKLVRQRVHARDVEARTRALDTLAEHLKMNRRLTTSGQSV